MEMERKPGDQHQTSMYFVVQPYKTDTLGVNHISSRTRIQYIVSLFAPESKSQKKRGVLAFSQSFGIFDDEVRGNDGEVVESGMNRFLKEQKHGVLENCIRDVLLEFSLLCNQDSDVKAQVEDVHTIVI
jgi:hypothetical protein